MSFLKITDPKKRDFIVEEYLKTKQNIQQNNITERVDKRNMQDELSKFFKPVTSTQREMTEDILSELKPIKKGIE